MDNNAGRVKMIILSISQVVAGACCMIITISTFEELSRGNTQEATLQGILAAAMAVLYVLPMIVFKNKAEANDQKNYKMKSGVITIGIAAVYALFLLLRIKSSFGGRYLMLSGNEVWGGESIQLSEILFYFLWLVASGGVSLGIYFIQRARRAAISE